jgi:subtilisin family serine protease
MREAVEGTETSLEGENEMKLISKILILGALALIFSPLNAAAQSTNTYILQSPSLGQAQIACQTYGMTMLSTIRTPDTFLVQMSASVPPDTLQQWVKNDPNVKHLELNNKVKVTETAITTTPYIPSMPVNTYVTDKNWTAAYGNRAWIGYVQQPALYAINGDAVIIQQKTTGTGIIAVIDTGVDAQNPILAPVVINGYDFIRNSAGAATDLADINQSTASILEQSTASILESQQVIQLNQSTAAILEQSTASILESTNTPSYFGHGTMVAGLIHLVAPGAKIMPLKAFNADGTGDQANIIRAIYYATDNGANVINMSFELTQISDALMKAINYATRNGVICVASAGNDGQTALVYPAAFGNVIAVGSVNQQNQQSTFTNYGPDLIKVAAPGEALITTYPGNHYAAVWGTSFSSALVAGAADLSLAVAKSTTTVQLQVGDISRALGHAIACGTNGSLGAGCLDVNQTIQYIKGMYLPH